MEDAATAEIARVQLWQWAYHGSSTDSGKKITPSYIDSVLDEEARKVTRSASLTDKNVEFAKRYMSEQVRGKAPSDFLTSDLMPHLAKLAPNATLESKLASLPGEDTKTLANASQQ
jgi:malate synthase